MPDEDLLEAFFQQLNNGLLDDSLPIIIDRIENRREILRERLRQMVKELFGSDAEIATPPLASETIKTRAATNNPFIQKSQQEPTPQVPPGLPVSPGDIDSLEEQMNGEAYGDPFAMRGAIISGLHSSQIGGA